MTTQNPRILPFGWTAALLLGVTGDYAAQYDRQRVRLRLNGQRTRLGFRITHVEHVASP